MVCSTYCSECLWVGGWWLKDFIHDSARCNLSKRSFRANLFWKAATSHCQTAELPLCTMSLLFIMCNSFILSPLHGEMGQLGIDSYMQADLYREPILVVVETGWKLFDSTFPINCCPGTLAKGLEDHSKWFRFFITTTDGLFHKLHHYLLVLWAKKRMQDDACGKGQDIGITHHITKA